jgi:hypothetical protein
VRLQEAKQLARRFKGQQQARTSCICVNTRNFDISEQILSTWQKKNRLRLFMNEMKHNPSGIFDNGMCRLLELSLRLTSRIPSISSLPDKHRLIVLSTLVFLCSFHVFTNFTPPMSDAMVQCMTQILLRTTTSSENFSVS